MALYPLNGNDVVKPLANTTIHIESALSQKRDVDTGVDLYVPSGYQHVTTNQLINNGTIYNDGEIYVDGEPIGGTGTVTSVGLSMPSIFSVSGSPVTGSGTIAVTLPNGTTGSGAVVLASGPSFSGIADTGVVSAGTWNGDKIGLAYGGTNADLSATGGTSQVLKQTTLGGAVTVGQLANTDITGLGTMSTQNASSVTITGGSIDGTTVGATTASTGRFTTITGTSTTASTSTTTGALVVAGGVGIAGAFNAGLRSSITGSADSFLLKLSRTVSSVGAVGIGPSGDRDTANTLDVFNIYNGNATKRVYFQFYDSGIFKIGTVGLSGTTIFADTTASSSSSTGAVVVSGGLGVSGAIYAGAEINSATAFKVAGTQVLTTQQTGMGATLAAATLTGTYATDLTALQNAYNKVVALETKLKTHGLIAT